MKTSRYKCDVLGRMRLQTDDRRGFQVAELLAEANLRKSLERELVHEFVDVKFVSRLTGMCQNVH
ncbi:hypothetical protein GQ600_23150 [Phytophthora cactorum]|nr:hypothetical protein GQ600_23150 [Phytophthora cactorum]